MCDGSAVVSGHGEQQCVLNWLSELLNTKSQKWAKLQVSELNWRRRTFELPVGLWWAWCIETTSSSSWPRQYYSPPARWPRSAAEAGTAGARGSSPSSSLTTSRPPPPPSWPAPGEATYLNQYLVKPTFGCGYKYGISPETGTLLFKVFIY